MRKYSYHSVPMYVCTYIHTHTVGIVTVISWKSGLMTNPSSQPHKPMASPRFIRKVSPFNQLSLPLTHQLARELVRIPDPLQGRTDSHVENSTSFAQHIAQLSLRKSDIPDIMPSFNVVSLFMRVPVDEALQVISELL